MAVLQTVRARFDSEVRYHARVAKRKTRRDQSPVSDETLAGSTPAPARQRQRQRQRQHTGSGGETAYAPGREPGVQYNDLRVRVPAPSTEHVRPQKPYLNSSWFESDRPVKRTSSSGQGQQTQALSIIVASALGRFDPFSRREEIPAMSVEPQQGNSSAYQQVHPEQQDGPQGSPSPALSPSSSGLALEKRAAQGNLGGSISFRATTHNDNDAQRRSARRCSLSLVWTTRLVRLQAARPIAPPKMPYTQTNHW